MNRRLLGWSMGLASIVGAAGCNSGSTPSSETTDLRQKARDAMLSELDDSGIEHDSSCVDAAFDAYTGDELSQIEQTLESDESSAAGDALIDALLMCVPDQS